jgi:hypothetical protein
MLNVKTLTDTMSRMELPQLQQYAALHKNDPYIVTLALSIANQKKQMKMGRDGQAGMMPQPKVADQQIAQMVAPPPPQQMAQAMPEDQGIGTLPAQNMQNMAGGGIVAFGGGGDVPGYAGPTGSFIGTSNMAPVPGAVVIGNMYIDPETGERKYLPGAGPTPVTQEQRNAANAKLIPSLSDVADVFRTPYGQKQAAIASQNQAATEQNKALVERYKPRRSDDQQFESEVAKRNAVVDPTATTISTPGAGTLPPSVPPASIGAKRQASPSAVAGAPSSVAPVGTASSGLAALNTKPMSAKEAMAAAGEFGDDKAMRAELQGYVDRQKKIGEEAVGSFQQGIAGLPEAYKKYEARLQKEEAEAATDKDKAVGMSIFKAGLAMMSGTSQNAFENIGKGAMVGLEDQQAALKDFKKAQRERDKSFADIEAARLADQRGDLKTKLELENRAADRNANAEGKMVEGIAKLFDTNKTNARGIYQTGFEQANQNQRTQAQIDADIQRQGMADKAAMARTQAQLSAPPAEARMAMMLGTGNTDSARYESGLKKMQEITSDKTGMAAVKLLTETNAKRETAMLPPLTMDELLRSAKEYQTLMYPKVVTDPGAKAPVYGRP